MNCAFVCTKTSICMMIVTGSVITDMRRQMPMPNDDMSAAAAWISKHTVQRTKLQHLGIYICRG
jgi:cytochrome b subunit of formate dehydrogenase